MSEILIVVMVMGYLAAISASYVLGRLIGKRVRQWKYRRTIAVMWKNRETQAFNVPIRYSNSRAKGT